MATVKTIVVSDTFVRGKHLPMGELMEFDDKDKHEKETMAHLFAAGRLAPASLENVNLLIRTMKADKRKPSDELLALQDELSAPPQQQQQQQQQRQKKTESE